MATGDDSFAIRIKKYLTVYVEFHATSMCIVLEVVKFVHRHTFYHIGINIIHSFRLYL